MNTPENPPPVDAEDALRPAEEAVDSRNRVPEHSADIPLAENVTVRPMDVRPPVKKVKGQRRLLAFGAVVASAAAMTGAPEGRRIEAQVIRKAADMVMPNKPSVRAAKGQEVQKHRQQSGESPLN